MPGMNSGIDVSDPTVVAAFKAALVHQGLIAADTASAGNLHRPEIPAMRE